ncbi:MAG: DUF1491 family protein [Alphaproteobacteria bacterium]|nr:DUF1491 family protein [Alphaproteobacteria bacterium]
MDIQIPTYLWLEGKTRELTARGVGVYIMQRGEKMGGLVLLKVSNCEGKCKLLTQQRDLDGVLGWVNALSEEIVSEEEVDGYIKRSINRDPDLWVVEVEDKGMENPFMD